MKIHGKPGKPKSKTESATNSCTESGGTRLRPPESSKTKDSTKRVPSNFGTETYGTPLPPPESRRNKEGSRKGAIDFCTDTDGTRWRPPERGTTKKQQDTPQTKWKNNKNQVL